jgi:TorA maturation chaperone TorD
MTVASESEVFTWLQRASAWRYFSLYFRLPTEQTEAELADLAREAPAELHELAEIRRQCTRAEWEQEFHRVLGAGGIPACASSYDDNALAGRGPMLADIAGFYQAFAYRPEPPPAEVPDHIAVELDFLAFLAVKIAFALHESQEERALVARQASEKFLAEHVGEWVGRFSTALERAASPPYLRAARVLVDFVSARAS